MCYMYFDLRLPEKSVRVCTICFPALCFGKSIAVLRSVSILYNIRNTEPTRRSRSRDWKLTDACFHIQQEARIRLVHTHKNAKDFLLSISKILALTCQ